MRRKLKMNQVVQVNPGNNALAFKSEAEVETYFTEAIRKQLSGKKILFGVGAVVALAVLMPIIWAAVAAGFGLLALVALLVSAGVAWKWIPNLFLRVENRVLEANQRERNRHLAALKAQARANPIEQRENSLRARVKQLAAVKEVLQNIFGKMETWASRLEERKRILKSRNKTEDLSKEEAAVEKIRVYYTRRKASWEAGMRACEDRRDLLESLRFKWEFAKEGGELAGQLDPAAEEAFLNDLLDEEAAKEVETRFNSVFAQIDLDIIEINDSKQLSFGGNVIDISDVHIPTIKEIQYVER